MEPEILILDEPTAETSKAIWKFMVFIKAQKRKNTTIILISHIMEDIARYFDRVAVMDQGNCVGQPRNVFTPKNTRKIGLDVPQITELF